MKETMGKTRLVMIDELIQELEVARSEIIRLNKLLDGCLTAARAKYDETANGGKMTVDEICDGLEDEINCVCLMKASAFRNNGGSDEFYEECETRISTLRFVLDCINGDKQFHHPVDPCFYEGKGDKND